MWGVFVFYKYSLYLQKTAYTMLRQLFLCLWALLIAPLALTAQDKGVDIFVLSSQAVSSEWGQRMMQPIDALMQERPDLEFSISNLPFMAFSTVEDLKNARDSVIARHTHRPRLVILVGGSSFHFAPPIQQHWPGIPMLLLGEQDYYCDMDYTLFGPGNPKAHRHSLILLKNHGANLTLVSAPFMLRRTVETILQIQPGLEKLYFVAGENYLSKERQWRLEKYMLENHPEITYHRISSLYTTTDQLISTLKEESSSKMAVIYGSWLIRKDFFNNGSTRHNTLSLIESLAPTYTMFGSDLTKHNKTIGYFSYSQEEYIRTVLQRILDVLDHGLPPSEMPFVYLEAGVPTLNYSAMENFGLDTNLIPPAAVVRNKPLSFWHSYKKQILWGALILLITLGLFVLISMSHSMRAMKKARIMAENANKMKTAFIQNMSHEVRTPLNAITGFSQLLCLPDGYVPDDEKSEYLSYIMNNSQLLTVMVNDMLDIADMENGRYSINNASTNLNEVIRQAIKAVEYRVPPGVKIIQLPGLDENERYLTDGLRVQQILINFLTNACKYANGGEIVIGSSLVENPGYVTLYVSDNGPGVPADKAESIFDRFYKLDYNKQGAGLGLSICRMMADNLGGKVWLDTQYTEGARFVLTIPKKEVV